MTSKQNEFAGEPEQEQVTPHAVLVTTKYRGVFFGYLDGEHGDTITLTGARNIVYWTESTHGFLGIAANGVKKGSRVGPRVDRLRLYGVTSVTPCTPTAVSSIEEEPWN